MLLFETSDVAMLSFSNIKPMYWRKIKLLCTIWTVLVIWEYSSYVSLNDWMYHFMYSQSTMFKLYIISWFSVHSSRQIKNIYTIYLYIECYLAGLEMLERIGDRRCVKIVNAYETVDGVNVYVCVLILFRSVWPLMLPNASLYIILVIRLTLSYSL